MSPKNDLSGMLKLDLQGLEASRLGSVGALPPPHYFWTVWDLLDPWDLLGLFKGLGFRGSAPCQPVKTSNLVDFRMLPHAISSVLF